jgi:hypothetical protein
MKPDNTAFSSAKEPGRGYHDIGGLEGEPIDREITEAKPWEKLSVVLGYALGPKAAKVMRTDENRRAREEMGVDIYNQLGYFERGIEATRRVLLEKGLFTEQELEARMAQIAKRIAEEGR